MQGLVIGTVRVKMVEGCDLCRWNTRVSVGNVWVTHLLAPIHPAPVLHRLQARVVQKDDQWAVFGSGVNMQMHRRRQHKVRRDLAGAAECAIHEQIVVEVARREM